MKDKKNRIRRLTTPGWLTPLADKLAVFKGAIEYPPPLQYGALAREDLKDGDPLWSGVVVGHWLCGPMAELRRGRVYGCVSKCGVLAFYEPCEIAGGKLPASCFACRPTGAAPPASRILSEEEVASVTVYWENPMPVVIDERSNVKNHAVILQWEELGRPVVKEVVRRSTYGEAFGWKCVVRDCHARAHRKGPMRLRVRQDYKTQCRIELVLQPEKASHEFEVDLYTGRTDVPWEVIVSAVKKAVDDINAVAAPEPVTPVIPALSNGNGKHAAPALVAPALVAPALVAPALVAPALVAPAPPAAPPAGPVDIAKLLKVQKNVETMLALGRDVNEIAELKRAAKAKLERAEHDFAVTAASLVEAEAAEAEHRLKVVAHQERIDDMESKLKIERDLIAKARVDFEDARAALAQVKADHAPTEAAVRAARTEVDELDRLEADRLKTVGDAHGLAVLLEALSKLSG